MIDREKELEKICKIIKSHSGICVNGAHTEFLCSYIKKRIEELNIGCDEFIYRIEHDSEELTRLINQSTINETYFFREEKQFLYLKNYVFPKCKDRTITIWSAACSTGEEILSLAMLCEECGVKARLYGTDIDSNALKALTLGEYLPVSVRTDGSVFHSVLEKYSSQNNSVLSINKDIINKIKFGTYNLHTFSGLAEIPIDGTVDIIFLRNVFIYFDEDTRAKIISFMEKKLCSQGYLFFSMSEIASILPSKKSSLSKQRQDMVYFLQKDALKPIEENKIRLEPAHQAKPTKDKAIVLKKSSRKTDVQKNDKLGKDEIPKKLVRHDNEGFFSLLSEHIEASRLDEAERLLEETNLQIDVQYIISYYKGLIEKIRGNDSEALQWFERSSQMNPAFWIAHIQCAMLLHSKDPVKARRKYIRCAEILEDYIGEKSSKYDFLLESFSAEYFYAICTKNIEKRNT